MAVDPNISGAGEQAGTPAGEKKPVSDFVTYGAEGPEAAEVVSPDPEPEDKTPDPEIEDTDDDEPDHDDERSEKGKKHKRGGFQKKIARLEAEIANLKAGTPPPKADVPTETADTRPRPKLEDFSDKTYEDYVEAVADWKADQAVDRKLQQRETQQKEANIRQEIATKAQNYQDKVDEARQKYADFDDVVGEVPNPSQTLAFALLDSDMGADVAYYLAQEPELYEKINKMSPLAVNRELGRIEERLNAKSGTKVADKPKLPKAPAPITPVGGTQKSGPNIRDDISYEEYTKARRAGKL